MALEFDYREEQSKIFGTVFRPVAKVKLLNENKKQWITEFFYVDSGADFTLIPYKMGLFLGLKAASADKIFEVQGINGVVAVILRQVLLGIGGHEFSAQVGWAQIEQVPLLLGRRDVFNRFTVTFKEADLKLFFDWRV